MEWIWLSYAIFALVVLSGAASQIASALTHIANAWSIYLDDASHVAGGVAEEEKKNQNE